MAYQNKVQKFDRINKSKITLKNSYKRTRTGAYKTSNRVKGHSKQHKH